MDTDPSHDDRPPRLSTLIWRGLRCRCPRCGGKGVMLSWFRLADRCPTCGYRFIREEGFWLGAYIINFGVAEGIVAIVLFGYIFAAANNPDFNALPLVIGGAAAAVLIPIAFFPFSRTIWAAIDLAMRPIEPAEEAEAHLYRTSITPPDEAQR